MATNNGDTNIPLFVKDHVPGAIKRLQDEGTKLQTRLSEISKELDYLQSIFSVTESYYGSRTE